MREPRTAVMIRGEASWQDSRGVRQTRPVCMEDKSTGGACIRVGTPVGIGASIQVNCRREQFTGVSKYCRDDGKEFLVGIQRDNTTISPAVLEAEKSGPSQRVTMPEVVLPEKSPEKLNDANDPETKPEIALAVPLVAQPDRRSPTEAQSSEAHAPREPESSMELSGKAASLAGTRKTMRHKLLKLAGWRGSKDLSNGATASDETAIAALKAEAHPKPERTIAPRLHVELLSTEEIYRSAGIVDLHGYSVHKVVDMVRNEHIRGLSKDLKRAAVLMALDAAKIPVDLVLRDAKVRKEALDSYEREQRQQIEAEWARKAEENVQIEKELEQIKEQYIARITRNQESLERERATFNAWLTAKQQEGQSITEAADLCRIEPKAREASSSN